METTAAARQTAAPNAAETLKAATGSGAGALSADFDTFLKLLTTQLKNQDPLQPMESTEFVAQLAQFSAVEQQIATTTKLDEILGAVSEANAGALGDWLGREVLAEAPLDHAGGPATVQVADAPAEALSAALVVRDSDGRAIAEIPYAPERDAVTWDGELPDGTPAPAGVYRFESRFAMPGDTVETRTARVFAPVVEARRDGDAIRLALAGGGEVAAADVTVVRAPTDPGA